MATEELDVPASPDAQEGRITPARAIKDEQGAASSFGRALTFVEERLAAGLRWIMFLSLLGLSLTMVAQVVMRYLLEWPFLGIEEMAPLLALWCYFGGMVYSTRHRTHIEGGILTLITSNPRIIGVARALGTAIALVVLCVFFYYAYAIVQFNFDIGRKSAYLRWPRYLWDLSFLVGMAGMALYLLIQLWFELRHVKLVWGGR
ncbi:TRAP transporter small permease [Aquibaculum arenosum]|uniref:TRAP transporter small permease protein n=1 Tax=Aquibaculum arenosum TaxID=3032591 RepID=A0ABT5YMJ7_9PROT|nr:TRAP transporter small permease subunit [Fodinicurvata sp. CAU 1616]MDF2096127.1 TRAP transporter small permease subunit [Fodinicurvata sp. CAU 1616]